MPSPARLCGAWSLSGEPVERLFPESRRRVPPRSAAGAVAEYASGRLWLRAAAGALERCDARVVAWDGFLSPARGGPWALGAPSWDASGAPAGHYVAAQADQSAGLLCLTRDPTGGERLYFCRDGELLLFASSLKTLLALRGKGAALDPEVALERGVAELAQFGDGTLVSGVREVLPGHRLIVESGEPRQEWIWGGLLNSVDGDAPVLGRRLRLALREAVGRALGNERRAAVALSGGVDSASVAALAVELLGPDRVTAFTYEYQDPEHPSETADAAQICGRLGIKDHRVTPITLEAFLDAAPEAVWLAEDPGYWKRSYPLALARAAESAGFDRFLTGFGIGSHMGWLAECARTVPRLPAPQWALRYWTAPRGRWARAMTALRPGLEPPMHRLFYPVLAQLRGRGVLADLRPFFPTPLGEKVEACLASPRVRGELDTLAGLPFSRQMQFQAFIHLNSCADVARGERVAREVGAGWLGPAHFPAALPYCYLPLSPWPPLSDPRRRMRPGKALLQEGMKDVLPEAPMRRRKNWAQTIGSRRWRDLALSRMDAAAKPSWEALREVFGDALEAAKRHAPEGMIPLAFWHRLFIGERFEKAPSWEELG